MDDWRSDEASGAALGVSAGIVGRLAKFALVAELSLMRTPDLRTRTDAYEGDWIVLPAASLRIVF